MMGKHNLFLTFCLLLLQLARYECSSIMTGEHESHGRVARSPKEIDDYIYGFNYDTDKVLAYEGEKVVGKPTEGSVDGNKNFIVIERVKKTVENGKADIGVLTSNEHRTFPGALLLANARLLDNQPDFVSIDRAPVTYTMNLPGMKEGEGSFTVVPTYANYKAAHDKTLNTWFEKYAPTHDIIAQMQSERTFAYSKEQLRVAFGVEFKYSSLESSVDFESVNKQEKTIMIFKYNQVFYTVSAQAPNKPSGAFDPNVTVQDVKQKMSSDNPPVLVDSVSYGRTIYVKVETSSTDNEAKMVLKNKLTSFDVSASTETEINQKCQDLSMSVYVMGGGSQHIDLITATSFQEVTDVIIKYAKLQRDNLGFPLSYSTEFLKDNSRAVVKGSTEYTETTRTVYQKGIIELSHTGWYVAQWSVTWDEISYDKDGNMQAKRVGWKKNWDDVTAPFNTEIELPGNTRNIDVFARGCTGLAWEWWRTSIDRKGISLINHRKFSIWGTTLNQKSSIEPPLLFFGFDGGNGGNGLPNVANLLGGGKNLLNPADLLDTVVDTASGIVHGATGALNPNRNGYPRSHDYSMYPNYPYYNQNRPNNNYYPGDYNYDDRANKYSREAEHNHTHNHQHEQNAHAPNSFMMVV